MSEITVEQEGGVGASAELTYRLIADDEHHQRFLPPGFSNFKVLASIFRIGRTVILSRTC